MSTITKIVQQKKRKKRYSIFLDDVYTFSVEEDILIAFGLKKGMTLTESIMNEITDQDQLQRAYLLAIHYLSYRMRATEEMRVYLQKKEIALVWIDDIINRLQNESLLDDKEFANAYVRDRIMQTSKGPRVIKNELIEKGIQVSIAVNATKQYTKEDQFRTALKWLQKEQRKKTPHAFRKRNEQLRLKLFQKGFDQDVVADVFEENKPEMDVEREEEIFHKEADKLYRKHRRKFEGFDLHMKLKASLFQKGFQSDMIDTYISNVENENNN